MTDELKPAPEAVERLRIMSKQKQSTEMDDEDRERADWQGGYDFMCEEARKALAALVIDRALRPATMPGDVVEQVARAISVFNLGDDDEWECYEGDATAALTAMQPAIQAAVDALEQIAADDERPGHPCDGPSHGHFGSIAKKALTTLRTVTEQGEGPTHD